MIVPFSLFSNKKTLKLSKFLRNQASLFSKNIPKVRKQLFDMDADITSTDYFSIGLFNSLILFSIMFVLFFALGLLSATTLPLVTLVAFTAALACQGIFFSFLVIYPKLIIQHKKNELETHLPFSLRYLLVQVSSGIPLYNAIADLSSGRKNEVTSEFKKIIKKTQEGIGFTDALEQNAMKNSSHFYKRAILQIANASRSGIDISNALAEVIKSITNDQRIAMKVYSSNLNVLTMMYMMLTIIMPTLGIVLLVILSNFIAIVLSPALYVLILIVLVLVQYLFLGLIEKMRPVVAV